MSTFTSDELAGITSTYEEAVAKASKTLGVNLSDMTPLDRLNYFVKTIVDLKAAAPAA